MKTPEEIIKAWQAMDGENECTMGMLADLVRLAVREAVDSMKEIICEDCRKKIPSAELDTKVQGIKD